MGWNLHLILVFVDLRDLGNYWEEQVLGVRPTKTPLESYG